MIKDVFEEVTKSVDLESLQYLAAMRVVFSVSESEEMQSMMGRFPKASDDSPARILDGQWNRLQSKARRMLNTIGVPEPIIDIILEKFWPISFEVYKWIFYHSKDTGIEFSSKFCWTPQFNIDYEKTARILVKNETFDIKNRFKLACLYCLEQEARSLWDIMTLSERRSFFVRGNLKKSDQNPIVLYWTYYIQDIPTDLWYSKTLNHATLFRNSVQRGFLNPTKFFFGKLKTQFRRRMIENSFLFYLSKFLNPEFIARQHLAIVCFLICESSPDYPENSNFFRIRMIFLYFLEWPYQKHFMVVVNRLGCYFTKWILGEVLEGMVEKDIEGFKDYDYKKLFMELWRQMPESQRTHVNTESRSGFIIFAKFVKKYFGFVFEESYFAVKAKFRAVVLQQQITENVTYFKKDNVEFFTFLVRELVITRSLMNRLLCEGTLTCAFQKFGIPFFSEPFGELMYLMDSIIETV